jgi:hypothetical protein
MALDAKGHPIPRDISGLEFAVLEPRTSQPVKLVAITQYIAKDKPFPVPYTLVATASCVVSLLNTARGSFSGYIGKAKVWDMAAAWPIAYQAGVRGMMLDGTGEFGLSLTDGTWRMEPQGLGAWGLAGNIVFYRDQELATILQRGGQ